MIPKYYLDCLYKDTEDFMDEEYDPEKFDQQMNKLFDDEYYESDDDN